MLRASHNAPTEQRTETLTWSSLCIIQIHAQSMCPSRVQIMGVQFPFDAFTFVQAIRPIFFLSPFQGHLWIDSKARSTTSVICQFDFHVFSGFCGFLGSRKSRNLETWKPSFSQLQASVQL